MPDDQTPDPLAQLEADEALALEESNVGEDQQDDASEVSQETDEEVDYRARYDELSRRIGQQGNELGDLRRERDTYRQQLESYQRTYQPPAQEQQVAQPDAYVNPLDHLTDTDRDYLENLLATDPLQGHRVIAQLEAQAALAAQEQQWEQRIAPLQQTLHQQQAGRIVEQLKAEYGDPFIRDHAQQLDSMIRSDPSYFSDEKTQGQRIRWALDSIKLREAPAPASNGQAQPRDPQNGQYAAYSEGGSNGRSSAPSQTRETLDPVLVEMRDVGGRPDAFGARATLP